MKTKVKHIVEYISRSKIVFMYIRLDKIVFSKHSDKPVQNRTKIFKLRYKMIRSGNVK